MGVRAAAAPSPAAPGAPTGSPSFADAGAAGSVSTASRKMVYCQALLSKVKRHTSEVGSATRTPKVKKCLLQQR